MKTALTIAGSDSCGGAGIQADIKTMTANGVYAMSAITALTAQNTTGVTDILESTPHFLAEQLDAVFTDITPDAVKIGMVSSAELIETIAAKLKQYGAKHIVVDPVMVATSGSKLLRDDAVSALCANLLPMAEVLTPNIPEAEILADMPIKNAADMAKAAQTISEKYGESGDIDHTRPVDSRSCAYTGSLSGRTPCQCSNASAACSTSMPSPSTASWQPAARAQARNGMAASP